MLYRKRLPAAIIALTLFVAFAGGCKNSTDGTDGTDSKSESLTASEHGNSEEASVSSEADTASTESETSRVVESKVPSTGGGGKTNTSKSTGSKHALEEVDKYAGDNLPKVDLKKFVLKVGTSGKSLVKFLRTGEEAKKDPPTKNNKLRYEAISQIEKRFNVIIEPVYYEYGKTAEVYSAAILSGAATVPHVILTSTWEAGNMMASNLLTEFEKVDFVDASKPWWVESLAKVSKIKGKTYLMSSAFTDPFTRSWMVAYNKKIASEVGLTSANVKKLVDSKQWTWDKFIEYSKKAVKDINGDGKLDDKDRWGYSAPRTDFTYAMMAAAGVGFYDLIDGKMTYALNNDKAIAALEKINRIITTENIRYPVENNTTQLEIFGKGQTLFLLHQSGVLLDSIREEGNMGLMPMPIGPNMSGYVSLVDHNSPVIIIPKTNKKLKETGLLLEAVSFAHWKLLPERIENYQDLYLDEDDGLSAQILYDNYNYMTVKAFQFNNTANYSRSVLQPLLNAVATPNEDISGIVASLRNSAQALIDQFFAQ